MSIEIVKRLPEDNKRIVFIGDTHHPYHDPVAIGLLLSFVRWFEPHIIYLIGDIIDFYKVSRYNKDPDQGNSTQEECDSANEFLWQLRNAAPDSEMIYRDGNHEERLYTYKISQAGGLNSLRCLSIPYLLGFEDIGIKYHRYKETILLGEKFVVDHGDRVRKGSSMTAKALLDHHQMSGICGHTHRMGIHYRTNTSGKLFWIENGCLCKLDPEYIHGTPDWQQGFTVAYYNPETDYIHPIQVRIDNNSIFFDGIVFKANV